MQELKSIARSICIAPTNTSLSALVVKGEYLLLDLKQQVVKRVAEYGKVACARIGLTLLRSNLGMPRPWRSNASGLRHDPAKVKRQPRSRWMWIYFVSIILTLFEKYYSVDFDPSSALKSRGGRPEHKFGRFGGHFDFPGGFSLGQKSRGSAYPPGGTLTGGEIYSLAAEPTYLAYSSRLRCVFIAL